MRTATERERPISIAMLALGGQGGGVLTNWLVEMAEANGYLAQSTYIAGVAQRTGATVYCIEIFPAARADELAKAPVFSPNPIPGDVDLVIAGEMAETGRAIQRGFVTPNATTLIASSHRVYSIAEKSAMGDGIIDQTKVAEIADRAAKRFIVFDMQAAADECGAVISSVLFGAIAGSGALPFERAAFESTIRRSGRAVDANIKGFAVGFDGATGENVYARPATNAAETMPEAVPEGPAGRALAERIAGKLPANVRALALHGALRVLDYQDAAYSSQYLDLLELVYAADIDNEGERQGHQLTAEVARQLALQMCYEDTIRVAGLKIRQQRFDEIRQNVNAEPGQPINVYEYFHPRIEEVCDTLPNGIGAFLARSRSLRKVIAPLFRKGRTVCTSNISGYLLLASVARLKRFRRGTFRFKRQQSHIDEWLLAIRGAIKTDYGLALAIAHCMEIVKGYGDTYERGLSRYRATLGTLPAVPEARRAEVVRRLHQAALADEQGTVFDSTLAQQGLTV